MQERMSLATFYAPSACCRATIFFSHQCASLVERFLYNKKSQRNFLLYKKSASRALFLNHICDCLPSFVYRQDGFELSYLISVRLIILYYSSVTSIVSETSNVSLPSVSSETAKTSSSSETDKTSSSSET